MSEGTFSYVVAQLFANRPPISNIVFSRHPTLEKIKRTTSQLLSLSKKSKRTYFTRCCLFSVIKSYRKTISDSFSFHLFHDYTGSMLTCYLGYQCQSSSPTSVHLSKIIQEDQFLIRASINMCLKRNKNIRMKGPVT